MKQFVIKSGRVKDYEIDQNEQVIFKTWNERKQQLSSGIKKTFKWVLDRYEKSDIALLYKEDGIITLVVEI